LGEGDAALSALHGSMIGTISAAEATKKSALSALPQMHRGEKRNEVSIAGEATDKSALSALHGSMIGTISAAEATKKSALSALHGSMIGTISAAEAIKKLFSPEPTRKCCTGFSSNNRNIGN
jgi:hypothetical protein